MAGELMGWGSMNSNRILTLLFLRKPTRCFVAYGNSRIATKFAIRGAPTPLLAHFVAAQMQDSALKSKLFGHFPHLRLAF